MRQFVMVLICIGWGGMADGKPLLTSSEMTYARACLEFRESFARMVPICEAALADPGAGAMQRLVMLDNLGSALLNLGRVDEAEARYRELLEKQPNAVAGFNGLGWVYRDRNDDLTSLEMFRESLDRKPSSQGLAGYGAMLIRTKQGSVEDGLQYIEAALAMRPDYRWALREKGWRLLDVDRDAEAQASFGEALALDTRDTNALAGLARALSEQEKYEDALEATNKAIAIDGDDAWFYERRAIILYELERYAQSERDADEIIARWPERNGGYVRKARALEALGRRNAALDVYENAQAELGFDAFRTYWHADMLANEARYDEAEALLTKVVESGKAEVGDYELLAHVTLENNRWDAARDAVAAGLALDADAEWIIFYDALVMLHDDRPDAAMDRFAEAVAKGLPQDRIGYFAGQMVAAGYLPRSLVLRARILNSE